MQYRVENVSDILAGDQHADILDKLSAAQKQLGLKK